MSDAIDRAAEAKVRELEHAIEQVANALHGDQCAEDPDPGERCNCDADDFYRQAEIVLDTLREAGLIAPASLREEWTVIYVDPPYGTSIPMDELHARSLATRNDTLTRRYVTDPEVVR